MKEALYNFILEKKHHAYRTEYKENLAQIYSSKGLSPVERMADRFERLMRAQTPCILDGEQICLLRTAVGIPDVFTEEEWAEIKSKHFVHELGYISNLSPNYQKAIERGLLALREESDEYGRRAIDAIIDLCDRYKEEALRIGRQDIADTLAQVPRYPARSFCEALQFFRILHFSLWLEGNYHNTVGCFDRYMYPYLRRDLENGVLTEDEAYELLCDFFLSFNRDSDLYVGVQQGDNGQSMMLGGIDADGNDVFNKLSELCLKASARLKMIDPKINLRVSKKTPIEIYKLGTQLTKAGLGFPQYSNDDVIIKALLDYGYDYEDAVNYTVAACWEFIIPGVGFDINNIAAVNMPLIVDRAVRRSLASAESFDCVLQAFDEELRAECDKIESSIHDIFFVPSPFMSILLDNIKYNNFGIHGTGLSCASDSLAAIKKNVFDEKTVTPERLLRALDCDFADDYELLHKLRFESPKMGQDDDLPDSLCTHILNSFADALKGRVNCNGGIFRAGTGSAMYYLWHASELGASPDGRRKGEPFGTNFAPSLFAKISGPVSVIKSFSKPQLCRTSNGGPLTLEFANSIFKDEKSVEKVASLVKFFIECGGHQLQLNSVDMNAMKAAQENPELYRQLVVRIWGWSAYFVELEREYQDHVIARQEYTV
jgi:formate C-acetyltransferase